MKTEIEIRAFLKDLEDRQFEDFVTMTERAGHWIDALEWVLTGKK